MRYVIGFFITIGLIVLLIVLLLHGGGDKKAVPVTGTKLEKYADTDTQVRLSIDGFIAASQTHRTVQITVGRDNATINIFQGYDGQVLQSQSYANSVNSYNIFLFALDHAGFTKGNTQTSLRDERGYCPNGQRYIFEIIKGSAIYEHFWSTSCGKPSTFQGNLATNRSLFQRQIPDYGKLVSSLNF